MPMKISVPQILCVRTRSSLSLKVSPGGASSDGDRLLDFRDARVPPLDGRAAPVNPVRVQPLAGGGHGVLDFLRIMLLGRCQRLFIAEQQQRLRRGLQPPLLESFCQQIGQAGGFNPKQSGQLAKQLRLHHGRALNGSDDLGPQFRHAGAVAGDNRQHRHAEGIGELLFINALAVGFRHVHHVQRDERGMAQLDDLGGVIKIPLEIRGVHDHHNQTGWRQFGQAVEQHVARNLLVQRIGAETVCARQIEHADIDARWCAKQFAFLAFDGDAGVIPDLGAQTGKRVEQGRLAAIRIARQDDKGATSDW